MIRTRDYVEAVLLMLSKHTSVYGSESVLYDDRKFEELVTKVDDHLAGLKDTPNVIVVQIEGGVVEDVKNIPAGFTVEIHDFDTDYGPTPEHEVTTNEAGDEYILTTFGGTGA